MPSLLAVARAQPELVELVALHARVRDVCALSAAHPLLAAATRALRARLARDWHRPNTRADCGARTTARLLVTAGRELYASPVSEPPALWGAATAWRTIDVPSMCAYLASPAFGMRGDVLLCSSEHGTQARAPAQLDLARELAALDYGDVVMLNAYRGSGAWVVTRENFPAELECVQALLLTALAADADESGEPPFRDPYARRPKTLGAPRDPDEGIDNAALAAECGRAARVLSPDELARAAVFAPRATPAQLAALAQLAAIDDYARLPRWALRSRAEAALDVQNLGAASSVAPSLQAVWRRGLAAFERRMHEAPAAAILAELSSLRLVLRKTGIEYGYLLPREMFALAESPSMLHSFYNYGVIGQPEECGTLSLGGRLFWAYHTHLLEVPLEHPLNALVRRRVGAPNPAWKHVALCIVHPDEENYEILDTSSVAARDWPASVPRDVHLAWVPR